MKSTLTGARLSTLGGNALFFAQPPESLPQIVFCIKIFGEARGIRDGGGFGSIIGRNSFQCKKADALKFLSTVMGIYEGSIK